VATTDVCKDPSIQPCPPCCGFMLNPQKLAVVSELPQVATRPAPSSFAEPVNGGSGNGSEVSTGTMVLAVAAVAIAGGTAWWLWSGRKRRR